MTMPMITSTPVYCSSISVLLDWRGSALGIVLTKLEMFSPTSPYEKGWQQRLRNVAVVE